MHRNHGRKGDSNLRKCGAGRAFQLTGTAHGRAIGRPQFMQAVPPCPIQLRGALTMASKKSSKSTRRTTTGRAKPRAKAAAGKSSPFEIPRPGAFGDLSNMAKMMTPEQAFELYRANAKIALDVINAAVESTAKLRRLQFEGEEQAR